MMYVPPAEILEKYAHVLINFALNSGEGVRPKETVLIQLPECAKPFFVPLRNATLKAGAYPIMQLIADDVERAQVYDLMNEDQLDFFPAAYYKGLVEQCDHSVGIIAEYDKYELAEADPQKIMRSSKAIKPYREWRRDKEAAGKFTWVLAMYGTEAMAREVNMSLEEYWQEIIAACYLDQPDPVAAWQKTNAEIERIRGELNALPIDSVHVEAEGIDLTVGLGQDRQWLGGSGRNIPSFEIFISPDCRRTEGYIAFNQPLYRYGNLIEGIRLEFAGGKVIKATADKNQDLLEAMIATENAEMIGEFSLTDGNHSRITRIMGETLFDENMGGPEGNMHIAVGDAYRDSYPGDPSTISEEQWTAMGYNNSVVHTDIVTTTQRTVTATLADGTKKVIYQNGHFQV